MAIIHWNLTNKEAKALFAFHRDHARRNLPTLLRIDTSNVDPIVDVVVGASGTDWITRDGRFLVGVYQRRGYGANEPWNPVYAGDTSPLVTDGANLVRCDETGAF